MLGPVSNENEGSGLGTGCVRSLSMVTCVRAGAGARVRGGVGGYPRGVHPSSRLRGCVCWT